MSEIEVMVGKLLKKYDARFPSVSMAFGFLEEVVESTRPPGTHRRTVGEDG